MPTTDLRHGDLVGIVGETDHGLIRSKAILLGETSPDWYLGELEDGSQVEFRIDQIESVEEPFHMGGFLDWFKKKPAPSEARGLIPVDPDAGVIYISPTGIAKYEVPASKKKGFLKPVTEAVKAFFTGPGGGSSIFDIFKTTTELIPEPEKGTVPYEKKPSLFAQFAPESKSVEPLMDKVTSIFQSREEPTALTRFSEQAMEVFEDVQPSAPIAPYEERLKEQETFADKMFGERGSEVAPSVDIFEGIEPAKERLKPFKKTEVVTEKQFFKAQQTDLDRGFSWEPLALWLPERNTLFPSVEDIARGILTHWGWELFDTIIQERNEFLASNDVDMDSCGEGMPGFYLPIQTIGSGEGIPDYLEGISYFLQIDWEEFRKYGSPVSVDQENEEFYEDGISEIWDKIIKPAYSLIVQAFELLKPKELPGEFYVLDGCSNWGNQSVIAYYEHIEPASEAKEEEEVAPAPRRKKKKRKAKR